MLEDYEAVIGMEVHAELKTERKMFCGCLNNPDETEPNKNICPVCLAHPGALPVANRTAIEKIIQIGQALHGEIPKRAVFSRKNYFYPDLPKGYQITSQPDPFVWGGYIDLGERKIEIDHVHLEEDTGTLTHQEGSSLVNFNRAGVPLMELVTKPVIKSGLEARQFCEELQLLLRYLKASEANMEKGEMRCEVNISIKPKGSEKLGTKVEIKNLNSFRVVERAVEYEIKRQAEVLSRGGEVRQETRGWDDNKQETFSQRAKEEAHDYRYFPEPDLPEYETEDFDPGRLGEELPELPEQKRERFREEYNLSKEQVNILIKTQELANFFEAAGSELKADKADINYKDLYNYLVSDLRGLMIAKNIDWTELKVTAENLADLVEMLSAGEIGSRVAKNVLLKMIEIGADPRAIVKEEGLEQVSDEGELFLVVRKIIKEQTTAVEEYKKGKQNAVQFLVGQAMKDLSGKGEPQVLKQLFEKELND